jgi:hypothetical protein
MEVLEKIRMIVQEGANHNRYYEEPAALLTDTALPDRKHPEAAFGDDGRIVGRYPNLFNIDHETANLESEFNFSKRLRQLTQPESSSPQRSKNDPFGFAFFDLTFPLSQGLVDIHGLRFAEKIYSKLAKCLSPERRLVHGPKSVLWNDVLLTLEQSGQGSAHSAIISQLEAFMNEPRVDCSRFTRFLRYQYFFHNMRTWRSLIPRPLRGRWNALILDKEPSAAERIAISARHNQKEKHFESDSLFLRTRYLLSKHYATIQVLGILEQIFPILESQLSSERERLKTIDDFVRAALFSDFPPQAALAATRSQSMLTDDSVVDRTVAVIREQNLYGGFSEFDLHSYCPAVSKTKSTELWLEHLPLYSYEPEHFVVLLRLAKNGVLLFSVGFPSHLSWCRSQPLPATASKLSTTNGVEDIHDIHHLRKLNLPTTIAFALIFTLLLLCALTCIQLVEPRFNAYNNVFPALLIKSYLLACFLFLVSKPVLLACGLFTNVSFRSRSSGIEAKPFVGFTLLTLLFLLSYVLLWLLG